MRVFGRRDSADTVLFAPLDSVRGALTLMQQQLRVAGIEVTADLPERTQAVRGFPLRLEQVLLNLLGNARDAVLGTAGGTGRIAIEAWDDLARREVCIAATDTGGGIPAEALGRVFNPFFTTKDAGKGTGLGLSISYAIIHEMGGRLEARNRGAGAEFTITLPAGEGPAAEKDAG
jgi:C4-dicarboxylate-specific signal transduction histidine kinase